ncbi:MAG: prohibitin family protein [Proteobacteria bacterium]|nr:prohibitin family protein [Pseudomonadota bacterium]
MRAQRRRFIERYLPIAVIYLMVGTLFAGVLFPYIVTTVPSGQVGLLWKRFRGGTALDPRQLKDEGLRTLWPWDRMFLYDLRLQSTTETYNAITKDGVNLSATINIRFRLKHDAIPQLHQAIGPDFIALLLRPEIGSRAREVIAEYTAEEVYSTKRQEVQNRIRGRSEAMMGEKMLQRAAKESEYGEQYSVPLDAVLNLYDTLVLGMELPPSVVAAINRKVEQYYLVQEYGFRVEREKKESERKKIEGEGIRQFQQTVSQGISDSYVRWRGIEATLELARSQNSKIVVIGSGRDGLPIILGNVDSPAPAPAATGAGTQPLTATQLPLDALPAPSDNQSRNGSNKSNQGTATTDAQRDKKREPDAPAGTEKGSPNTTKAPTEKAPAAASPTQPAVTPGASRGLLPFSLSDIESLFSRSSSTTNAPPQSSPEAPAATPATTPAR